MKLRSMTYAEILREHKKTSDPKRKKYLSSRLWQIRNPEKIAEYNRRKRVKIPRKKLREYYQRWLKRRYGGGVVVISSNTARKLARLKNNPQVK